MTTSPEGPRRSTRRIHPLWLVAAALFACYLLFRLVQVSIWLFQHV